VRPLARRLAFAIAVCLIAALGVTRISAAFRLPEPDGPFPVGTTCITLARLRTEGAPLGRFYVQIWYPGAPSAERAAYGTDGPGLKRWIYHRIVGANAAPNVALAAGAERFPVLIYAAGWGGERTDNTVLAEQLASHGFVVAAFDDPEHDVPPLPSLGAPLAFDSEAAYEATLRLAHTKLRYEVRRAVQVLDRMTALDGPAAGGRFSGRLDLDRAGAFGFSFGGAVALAAARDDRRLKAAMNMDGWIFDAGRGYKGGVLYLLVSDLEPPPARADLTSPDLTLRYTSQLNAEDGPEQEAVLHRGGYELHFAGADHLDFTDAPLFAPMHRFGHDGVDPHRMSATLGAYSVAFFERALLGKPSPLLRAGTRQDPRLVFSSWP